eukprot:TRINITY_DN10172_c0_g1_i3.p2 TRINITY_DN10172_c0_g1~~TRINITY_DN10172_c0_g1_i3.p2  ORF type:complete len:119 (+),score=14.25 TRINITY_DN10172_c0_g1_i3:222-578(+)
MAAIFQRVARSLGTMPTAASMVRAPQMTTTPIFAYGHSAGIGMAPGSLASPSAQGLVIPTGSELIESILGGIMLVKRTFRPNVLKRKKVHGFLARIRDRDGRKILNRRRAKGRARLSA